ncbi:MAG: neutral zinc metallopeptidase [Acidimicrobiales bacterium]
MPPSFGAVSRVRRSGVAAVLVVVALVLASCGVDAGSGAQGAGGKHPGGDGRVIGADTATTTSTTEPATTTTTAPPANVDVQGDDGSATNATVANAIADLQAWWGKEFPRIYDKPYRPVDGGFYATDKASVSSSLPCAPDDPTQVLDNAYYCPADDAVVWDQAGLMPRLADSFGDFAPAVVIAHEWGHAIQARSNFDAPTIIFEQQADCFAGAWVRHVRTDPTRFQVTTGDLDQALAGFLSLRDAPGSQATDPNAHGSGFDRVRAFQEGYEDGTDRCAEYRDGDPKPFQFPFVDETDQSSKGDLPLHSSTQGGILDLVFGSLDFYWTKAFPELGNGQKWDPLGDPVSFTSSNPPTCGGKTVHDVDLFVCEADRYLGYQEGTTITDVYDQGGDFAVATLIATKYGLDAEAQLGDLPSDVTAGLRADCYAGSWAESLLPDRTTDTRTENITLSPGDLDEAVGVLLSFRSKADRAQEGPGFDRVRAFRIGVIDGAVACAAVKKTSG